ncbi:hypothetical protein BST95_09010 [Halioglobus japonicus]|uniref:UvrD-like helicase ATP-binding domain-containing protein n=1 Tax=Halioglobus japonicus TaxID=930805 RepID=A0AAP8MEL5_9GAMM|nr:UvrD-helicase domain-containing protein [Halioglobus japonicus]AQA18350.1 hypothetical protein BST95_09010 [Halioglobus japonicus]PLW86368.1 hypothetical protein C0029_08050 [Halioglobus japonicus]GHD13239.1 hypothetical protein GCM10007052_15160 [Halioglobus japonicus]
MNELTSLGVDQQLLIDEGERELEVLERLLKEIENQRQLVRSVDVRDAVFNLTENMDLKVNPQAKLNVLDELRTSAYGKVVHVEDEDGKSRVYRIAQANGSVIKNKDGRELMVVNRLAPVAGILAPAEIGDEVELPVVGTCHVTATDLLERYDRGHLDDFISLIYSTESDPDTAFILKHVRASVDKWNSRLLDDAVLDESTGTDGEEVFTGDSRASLGSSFYTRTTTKQEELIRRPRRGLLIVEGIAGSGKTSVALGRVKALYQASEFSETEDEYDAFFNDKSQMVGFVLHKQLINYLEQTLVDLNLSQMKVREFKELQNELLRKRGGVLSLKMPGNADGRYSRIKAEELPFEQSMAWLRLVEKEVVNIFMERIETKLTGQTEWIRGLGITDLRIDRLKINHRELLEKAWEIATESFLVWKRQLLTRGTRTFYAEGFVRRIKTVYERFYDLVSEDARWYYYDSGWHLRSKRDDEIEIPFQPFNGRQFPKRGSDWLKTFRDRVRTQFRQCLYMDSTVEHMPRLSDWYGEAIGNLLASDLPENFELNGIVERVNGSKLSDADLNILLAITNMLSSGYEYSEQDQKRIAAYLSSPHYYSTVFIDEVQDFSEIEVYLMGEASHPDRKAVTVVGDFKQQLYEGKVSDLSDCFPSAAENELEVQELLDNKRQCENLANHSAYFRATISRLEAPSDTPEPIYGDELTDETISEGELRTQILERIVSTPVGQSIAVICPTNELAKELESGLRDDIQANFRESQYSEDNRDLNKPLYVHFTVPKPTKGLEFDVVIAPCFDHYDLDVDLEAHAAYVAVTRPKSALHILRGQ